MKNLILKTGLWLLLALVIAPALLRAQSSSPSLTIEAVLRAVQERKLMVTLKKKVQSELYYELTRRTYNTWGGQLPANEWATYGSSDLIVWPGTTEAFPSDGSITNFADALKAMNVAALSYNSLRDSYLRTVQNDGLRTRHLDTPFPPVPKFTMQNWRENLVLLASCVDQLNALSWYYFGNLTNGHILWSSSSNTSGGSSQNLGFASNIFSSPATLGRTDGTILGASCQWNTFGLNADTTLQAFAWKVSSINCAIDIDGAKNASVQSDLSFFSGVKTKTSPVNWPSAASIPARNAVLGEVEWYLGSDPGGYGRLFNTNFASLHPTQLPISKSVKIASSHADEVVLGSLAKVSTTTTSAAVVGLGAEFANARSWMQLPAFTISECKWVETKDASFLATVKNLPVGANVDKLYRMAAMPYAAEAKEDADSFDTPDGAGWSQSESGSARLFCVYKPKFTPLVTTVVAKNIGLGVVDAGLVSFYPGRDEPVRVHVGRGRDDRHQQGWLSAPMDGFGTLYFVGSQDAFEVLYEDDPAKFEAPLPGAAGGASGSWDYNKDDEFTTAQINASIGFPFVDTSPAITPSTRYRRIYLQRWLQSRLRQVCGGDVLVDVIYLTGYQKQINFYWVVQKGPKAGGFYQPTGEPFKTIVIDNPTAIGNQLPTTHRRLRVTENGKIKHVIDQVKVATTVPVTDTIDCTISTTADSGFSRQRTVQAAYVSASTSSKTTWKETLFEGGKTWVEQREYRYKNHPGKTDSPVLSSNTITQGSDSATVAMTWNETGGSLNIDNWSPSTLTQTLNGNVVQQVTFDTGTWGMVSANSSPLMGKTLSATHTLIGNEFASIWKLGGSQYSATKHVYGDAFQKVTHFAGTELMATETYGAPDSVMPWVLKKVERPDGWNAVHDSTFTGTATSTVVSSGWDTNRTAGTTSTTVVNRFGGLMQSATLTSDGLTVSSVTGSGHTPWGVPTTVTGLPVEGTTSVAFNTSTTPANLAKYGTLDSVTDVFGHKTSISGYDDLARPTSVSTGFGETLTPDYSNPLESKVTSSAGYTEKALFSGLGELKTSSTTEGGGASLDMSTGSVTVDGRSVPLRLSNIKEITGVNSGLGGRGTDTEIDVSGGQLRHTLKSLNQSNAAHHDIKTYYDDAGRLVKLERLGANGDVQTETWSYPTPSTVIHTPGPGPVILPITQTLSSDGLTLTVKEGSRDATRISRKTENGKLVFTTEINDDSGGNGDEWRVVSTRTLDPASGETTFKPWSLNTQQTRQTTALPGGNGSITTIASSMPNGTGGNSSSLTLTKGRPSAFSGMMDGLPFNMSNFSYNGDRLTGVSGTLAGRSVGLTLDEDGRLATLFGPGFNKTYTYGGAPAYQVSVSDSFQNTTQILTTSAVGDLTGLSGDGVEPITASTQDLSGGRTQTTFSNWSHTRTNAADGSLLAKDYAGGAISENIGYSDAGLPLDSGTGPGHLALGYDRINGLLQSTASGSGSYAVTEKFYRAGPRQSVTAPDDARTFTYLQGQLASESHTAGPWAGTTLTYGQDTYGRPGALSVNGGAAGAATYLYEGDTSRLGSVSLGGITAGYQHNPTTGQRSSLTRGTLVTTPGYDNLGRQEDQTTGTFQYHFPHNAKHKITSRTASTGVDWYDLDYDSAGRLTSATINGTVWSYGYDARGNRVYGGRVGSGVTYTVSTLNRPESSTGGRGYGVYGRVTPGAAVRVFRAGGPEQGEELPVDAEGIYQGWWPVASPPATPTRVEMLVRGTLAGAGSQGRDAVAEEAVWVVIPSASETFVYDDAGRLTEDATWSYAWDAGSRLIGLTRKAGTSADTEVTAETISYRYDADGRRIGRARIVTKTGGVLQTEVSTMLWDRWLPLCEDRTLNGAALPRRWFVWGEDVSGTRGGAGGIGGLLAIQEEGGRTLLPVEDGLGNISAVINAATGSAIARYDYGPYGEIIGESGEVAACPFRYQSKWWDAAAGLNYFGYRHYSPRLGRWLSRDPLGEAGGMNLYAYCEGDPVNNWDYLGMVPGEELAAINRQRIQEGLPPLQMMNFMGGLGVPTMVCHGRNGMGRIPGVSSNYSLLCGDVYDSGTEEHKAGNLAAGFGGAIARAPKDVGNLLVSFSRFLRGWDRDDVMEPYYDAESTQTWAREGIYSGVDHDSLITGSGEIGGGVLLMLTPIKAPRFLARFPYRLEANWQFWTPFTPPKGVPVQLNTGLPMPFRLVPKAGLKPSSFGLKTIAEDPRLLEIWNDSLRAAASSQRKNAYMNYLQALERGDAVSNQMLEEAFGAVNSRFLNSARSAGYDISQLHHWNFNKGSFPTQIVDPRHLVPTSSRTIHEYLHRATSGNPSNIWKGPIAPEHVIPIPDISTPLLPY